MAYGTISFVHFIFFTLIYEHMRAMFIPFLLFILFLSVGCQKEIGPKVPGASPAVTDDEAVSPVKLQGIAEDWLAKAAVGRNGQPSQRIEELRKHLLWNKLQYSRYSDRTLLIVVPVATSYKVFNNADSLRTTHFVLHLDAEDNVQRAQVVQYLSSQNNLDKLDAAGLSAVLEQKRSALDGRFVMLAANGRFEYDLQFVDGKLKQERRMVKELPRNSNARSMDETCYDFYLYVYVENTDGSWWLYIQFLGSICDNDCSVTGPGGTGTLCDSFETPGDGGGGGGGTGGGAAPNCNNQVTNYQNAVNLSKVDGGVPTEYINSDDGTTRHVTIHWRCFTGYGGSWWLESIETGVKVNNGSGWQWVSLDHGSVIIGGSLPSGVSLIHTSGGVGLLRFSTAKMSLTLNLNYFFVNSCPNTPIIGDVRSVTKTYTFTSPILPL